jgi:hypothetical protein
MRQRPLMTTTPGALRFQSDDGAIVFALSADPDGVQVERTRTRSAADHPVTTVMRFRDEEAFTQWCDTDALRYTHPLLFTQIRRGGLALFQP